jgi:hypothetical protein
MTPLALKYPARPPIAAFMIEVTPLVAFSMFDIDLTALLADEERLLASFPPIVRVKLYELATVSSRLLHLFVDHSDVLQQIG